MAAYCCQCVTWFTDIWRSNLYSTRPTWDSLRNIHQCHQILKMVKNIWIVCWLTRLPDTQIIWYGSIFLVNQTINQHQKCLIETTIRYTNFRFFFKISFKENINPWNQAESLPFVTILSYVRNFSKTTLQCSSQHFPQSNNKTIQQKNGSLYNFPETRKSNLLEKFKSLESFNPPGSGLSINVTPPMPMSEESHIHHPSSETISSEVLTEPFPCGNISNYSPNSISVIDKIQNISAEVKMTKDSILLSTSQAIKR